MAKMRMERNFKSWAEWKLRQFGERFDGRDLDGRFVRFFESGERIKIRSFGETFTGTVGVTTGWRPVFILLRTSRSMGSSITLGPNEELLAVKRGRKYIAIGGN